MGYLLPTENVMQFIGPVLGVFALVGRLFVPVTLLPTTIQDIAPYMPPYHAMDGRLSVSPKATRRAPARRVSITWSGETGSRSAATGWVRYGSGRFDPVRR